MPLWDTTIDENFSANFQGKVKNKGKQKVI